jgi:signal transduction histidine kinase/DNA-binding response OmpR family regulator
VFDNETLKLIFEFKFFQIMRSILRILFIEDVQRDAELECSEIEKNNIVFERLIVSNKKDFIDSLESFNPDIIISDYSLPQFNGMTALQIRNNYAPSTPFILVTGSLNEEVAVEFMKAGADDYILKGNLSRLGPAVINSINKIKLLKKIKTAEGKLLESYSLNESLIKTIPFGMNIVNSEGTIMFQSDIFTRLFGEGAIGTKCWDLICDDKKQCRECPLKTGITLDKSDVHEAEGVLGNRTFEISHAGMLYKGEKAILEIFLDITDRKLAEEELVKAKETAEESEKLKTAFLNNISHEIRTPMNAIIGFSALLCEPDNDPVARQSYIEIIMQSSNHLLEIISDIVDISNIDANLVKPIEKEVNIKNSVKMLYDQFLPRAFEKNIKLIIDSGLEDRDALILTDNTKVTQILTNLVSNALKFTDEGSITIRYNRSDDLLEFQVEDTGIGILPVYYQKIFDRFFQVQDSVSRIYEGTGLGLSISKANVELIGGKIWLTSEHGKGTTFFFTIPFKKQIAIAQHKAESMMPDDNIFSEKKKILVAEDIESNFKLIKYFLSRANVDIIKATNGKEAVEKCLSDRNIDMVLMDIKMPVMDGFTAVKLIRKAKLTLPIIAQTAYSDDRDSAIAVGCDGFISKPFDKKSLLKVMAEFI